MAILLTLIFYLISISTAEFEQVNVWWEFFSQLTIGTTERNGQRGTIYEEPIYASQLERGSNYEIV